MNVILLDMKNLIIITSFFVLTSSLHLKDRKTHNIGPASYFNEESNTTSKVLASEQCSQEFIKNIPADQFHEFLNRVDMECLRALWRITPHLGEVYNDEKVDRIILDLKHRSLVIANIEKYLLYLRVGYFHDFYNNGVGFDAESKRDLLKQSITFAFSVIENENNLIKKSNALDQWVNLVDTAIELSTDYIDNFKQVLQEYSNYDAELFDREVRRVPYSLFLSIARSLANPSFEEAYNLELQNEVTKFVDSKIFNDERAYLNHNAVWTLRGVLEYVTSQEITNNAKDVMVNSLNKYEYLSEGYLWVVSVLTAKSDCIMHNEVKVCKSEVQEKLEKKLFLNEYEFSAPRVKYITSLDYQTVANLHLEIGQSSEGFSRYTKITDPIPGDINDLAILKIYNTWDDYKTYHSFLTDLPTNNGGIYIESQATLYTYQRTPQQSIYTLTELVKHEFVHYLAGRYIMPGNWGQTVFYENERLTWFDEGLAELIAGSNGRENIRKSLIKLIRQDQDRLTIEDIVTSRYRNGFKFYRYGAFLFAFLKEKFPGHLEAMLQSNLALDVFRFDITIAQLKDPSVNKRFQEYIDSVLIGTDVDYPLPGN